MTITENYNGLEREREVRDDLFTAEEPQPTEIEEIKEMLETQGNTLNLILWILQEGQNG
ncbi:MAG: hypothetical protein KBT47_08775 [Armatimonadetes bacterium]|nr:hypothetical protein [Candidatus Hippobium faecium]